MTGSDSLSRSGPAPDRLRTVLGNGPRHSRAQIFTKSLLDKPPAGVCCLYQSLAQMARATWAYWGYFVMILIDRRSRGYRKGKNLALVVALVASIHLSPTALASPGESSKIAVASWAYNATAGVNYSNSYWWHRNPSYAQFGNDCANFLSQTLKSAGAPFLGAPTGSGSTTFQANGGPIRPRGRTHGQCPRTSGLLFKVGGGISSIRSTARVRQISFQESDRLEGCSYFTIGPGGQLHRIPPIKSWRTVSTSPPAQTGQVPSLTNTPLIAGMRFGTWGRITLNTLLPESGSILCEECEEEEENV